MFKQTSLSFPFVFDHLNKNFPGDIQAFIAEDFYDIWTENRLLCREVKEQEGALTQIPRKFTVRVFVSELRGWSLYDWRFWFCTHQLKQMSLEWMRSPFKDESKFVSVYIANAMSFALRKRREDVTRYFMEKIFNFVAVKNHWNCTCFKISSSKPFNRNHRTTAHVFDNLEKQIYVMRWEACWRFLMSRVKKHSDDNLKIN